MLSFGTMTEEEATEQEAEGWNEEEEGEVVEKGGADILEETASTEIDNGIARGGREEDEIEEEEHVQEEENEEEELAGITELEMSLEESEAD